MAWVGAEAFHWASENSKISKRELAEWKTTTRLATQSSNNQTFLQPEVLTTGGLITRGTYNQGSDNQGFLQPGVLQQGVLQPGVFQQGVLKPGVLTTRGLTTGGRTTRGLKTSGSYSQGSYNKGRPVTRGGARGAFAPPTGPKGPHFDTQYPS